MEKKIFKKIKKIQKDEITGYQIYKKLSYTEKDVINAKLLGRMAEDELKHYNLLKAYTKIDIKYSKIKIIFFTILAKILGLTFTLKLMENSEKKADLVYAVMKGHVRELDAILLDENQHELQLINMIKEEKLNYAGSIVLGLNDALVELTGALAGFTFAIQNSRLIAIMGFITGIAATLSMAASEFLSRRQEGSKYTAFKSCLYTGTAYLITVILLIIPFFIFSNPFFNLAIMMGTAILIILAFNYYISVAKDLPFRQRFLEMAIISISVATLSFGIGWAMKTFFKFEI